MDNKIDNAVTFGHTYTVECFDAAGRPKWVETVDNLVVNTGLDEMLNQFYKGSSYTAAHYVGLISGASPTIAAGDTMASHSGWTLFTDYDESNRQTLTMGTVASQSVSNSASKATFTINAAGTVGGGFVTTSNTKSGTAGTLIGAAAFSSARSVESGDSLSVTVTASLSSS